MAIIFQRAQVKKSWIRKSQKTFFASYLKAKGSKNLPTSISLQFLYLCFIYLQIVCVIRDNELSHLPEEDNKIKKDVYEPPSWKENDQTSHLQSGYTSTRNLQLDKKNKKKQLDNSEIRRKKQEIRIFRGRNQKKENKK